MIVGEARTVAVMTYGPPDLVGVSGPQTSLDRLCRSGRQATGHGLWAGLR